MRVSSKDLCSSVAWATGAPALLAMCGHAVMSLAGSGDFGGPGPGQQRRMGEGYHGGAEQYQFSAATPDCRYVFFGHSCRGFSAEWKPGAWRTSV
jgi:hypothetical protein